MSTLNLEAFIGQKMSDTNLPGLSIALIEGREVTWTRGFGFRDVAHGRPATAHTLYNTGSVTKSFTAAAIMQLAEQGKLSIDDLVSEHIPVDIRPFGEPIRIWHLLTHTTGIPALASSESIIRNLIGEGEHWLPLNNYQDLIAFLADAEDWAVTKPGERWFYLNEGYQLLGYIIEMITGMTYQAYVRQHLLEPLGMARSFYFRTEVDEDPDVATPYIIRGSERRPTVYPYRMLNSHGGLMSNVLDLAAYVAMYLGQGQASDTHILTTESVQTMATPRIDTPAQDGPFGQSGYGYGLMATPNFLGETLIGHGGSVYVSTAYIGYVPAKNIGVAVLANGSGYTPAQFGMAVLANALGHDIATLPFVAQAQTLAELEGTYETYRGTMKVQVKRDGDFLTFNTDQGSATLIPEAIDTNPRRFYTLSSGSRLWVEFHVNDNQVDLLYERYRLKRTGPKR